MAVYNLWKVTFVAVFYPFGHILAQGYCGHNIVCSFIHSRGCSEEMLFPDIPHALCFPGESSYMLMSHIKFYEKSVRNYELASKFVTF